MAGFAPQSNPDQYQSYTNTYTTFSGADIVASFSGSVIGNLMGITWSVTREKAPIYTMGSPNPRSFSRGKRGLAGSLMFMVFDRPSLYTMLAKQADNDDIKYFTRSNNLVPGFDATFRGITPISEQADTALNIVAAFPHYSDQIPPFDITITFANEYGQAATRTIYGVELLNEGSGASMDDIVIEETMTYVARDVGPMVALKGPRDPNFNESALDSNIVTP
jgi:hypothetical protein